MPCGKGGEGLIISNCPISTWEVPFHLPPLLFSHIFRDTKIRKRKKEEEEEESDTAAESVTLLLFLLAGLSRGQGLNVVSHTRRRITLTIKFYFKKVWY